MEMRNVLPSHCSPKLIPNEHVSRWIAQIMTFGGYNTKGCLYILAGGRDFLKKAHRKAQTVKEKDDADLNLN